MICAMILSFLLLNKFIKEKVEAYLYAVLLWTLYMFAATEILSIFQSITMISLWLAWAGLDIILFCVCLKNHVFTHMVIEKSKIHKGGICVALFMLSVAFLAVKTMPYNWDSMTYHLGRIVHWADNQSVAHYASNVERQISSPVLESFINLHIYVMLNGYDRFLNLVQCFSYFTNGLLVYHIARKLGCEKRYCILAGALVFSMPIAFGEALTTQTDNFSAMYGLGLVYLLLDFCDSRKKLVYDKGSLQKVIMMGLCVSFIYLAKPSVGIGIAFFALWLLVISVLRRDSVVTALKLILTAVPGMVIVMIPEMWRNLKTFQSLAASNVSSGQMIGSLHERYIAVNFLKNFTANMPSVWLYNSSDLIWKYMLRFSRWLGVDINDSAISNAGVEFVVRDIQAYQHDYAVNPMIVWLLIITVIMLLFMIRKIELRKLKSMKAGYYLTSAGAFLIFCAILKWSPWRNRYMIFYLAALCPAIVCVIEWFMRKLKRDKIEFGFMAIAWFCIIVELSGLFSYHAEIALKEGNDSRYFLVNSEAYEAYRETADYLNDKRCKEIGILIGGGTYEYPLWKMVNADRIEHVRVTNDTGILEDMTFVPEVILVIDERIEEDIWECHGMEYGLTMQCGDCIQIFEKVGAAE